MSDAASCERWWTVTRGPGPVVATAIHDGHELRPAVAEVIKLADADRLREEDPFTAQALTGVPTHIAVHRSRFEVDLNRAADRAVYRTPEQSWGLRLWRSEPGQALVAESLAIHAAYYRMLGGLLDNISEKDGRFVLIDAHSYNHRRDGPDAAAMPPGEAPDINIGTFSMPRTDWAFLLDPLMDEMRRFDFNGRRLDVRENVAFQGKGEQTRFVHDRYPGKGCAIALEFKKFFMDEWTGEPNPADLKAMRDFVTRSAEVVTELLQR
jgi:hypothetical protein